jgi:hypothetical protein
MKEILEDCVCFDKEKILVLGPVLAPYKKVFQVFRKSNFFLFSDREFFADHKCSGCLFSILSIF